MHDLTCVFCSETETCGHLFFEFSVGLEACRAVVNLTGFMNEINLFNISSCGLVIVAIVLLVETW